MQTISYFKGIITRLLFTVNRDIDKFINDLMKRLFFSFAEMNLFLCLLAAGLYLCSQVTAGEY